MMEEDVIDLEGQISVLVLMRVKIPDGDKDDILFLTIIFGSVHKESMR